MNTQPVAAKSTNRRTSPRAVNPLASTRDANAAIIEQNFDGLNAQPPIVEHLTIPGFLRLVDHRWSFDDIRRFGDKATQMAEAMSLAYLTATDRSLGVLRMFPEPLLRRIYDTMAPQFGWPQIINVETPELEDQKKRRDAIKANERSAKTLQQIADTSEDAEVLASVAKLLTVLQTEAAQLRGESTPAAGAVE